jgi:hypothetical protein
VVIGAITFAATHASSGGPTPTIPTEDLRPPVDGIHCGSQEQVVYHIHQHLALYDHGTQVALPSSVGIWGGETQNFVCYYWIHVHALYPGIIHVESPKANLWTLGNFFDIWKATKSFATPQSSNAFLTKLESASPSQITVFVDGKRWTRGYRTVPLAPHAVIQIDLGKPVVPPQPFTKWNGL